MKKEELNDSELLMLMNENNEEAKNLLYKKYKFIVSIYVKKYRKMAYKLGMEISDLKQEALVGFSDGLVSYSENKNTNLNTFLSLCVERRIQTSLVKASRKKNMVLNDALSLEHIYDKFDSSLGDFLSDHNENNPLTKLTRDENYSFFTKKILAYLSNTEKDVLYLMVDGFNYKQIATILNVDSKSVDNTMQRIKNKVKEIIKYNEINN